jgi:conjugal transfer pilus assembly protein TraV
VSRHRARRLLAAGLALGPLAGCATLGESEFGCRGYPGEPLCLSASEVYAATETTDRVVRPTEVHREDSPAETAGVASAAAVDPPDAALPPTAGPAPESRTLTLDPQRLHTPAGVLRIWIAPWEDTPGNLHAPGHVFTEVEPRRWRVGVAALATPEVLRPLQVEPREATPGHRESAERFEVDGRSGADPLPGRRSGTSASPRAPTLPGTSPAR